MRFEKLIPVAQAIAKLSKDPSTKVGCLIVGPDGEAGPWGFNGAPRGSAADEDERFAVREEKLHWAEHAERNAIYAAARQGYPTKGCTIIVTHFPCMECARAIVQAGIVKVITPNVNGEYVVRWGESFKRTALLFNEVGITVEYHSDLKEVAPSEPPASSDHHCGQDVG
jgi:dCMP deaminase